MTRVAVVVGHRRGRRRAVVAGLAAAGALLAPLPAAADTWPTRPLTLVSPYPAGGITDLLARILAESLARELGQAVVVENRTGAGGAVAHASVAKAAPDGYTLIIGGSAPTAIAPALNRSLTFGPQDFAPIGFVAELPIVLCGHPSIPGSTPGALLEFVKAHAGTLACGHHGVGSSNQFACLTLAKMAGVKIADVPYRGAPQVNADLVANRVQIYFGTLPTQLPLAKDGKVKIFGVASAARVSTAPEIPTLDEQGLTGLNFTSWNALYAPAGTPEPAIRRLSTELLKILGRAEVRQRIEATGSVLRTSTPAQLGELTMAEFEHYRRLSAETGIRVE